MTICHPDRMAHRPYPSRERALHQLDRHYPKQPPLDASAWGPDAQTAGRNLQAGFAALPTARDYVLSLRRPA